MSERLNLTERPSDRQVLEALLTVPGNVGNTYSRFWKYSQRNLGLLALQGCPPEPVATYTRWTELGRQVQKGEKAYSILRPISIRVGDAENEDERKYVQRFKLVKTLFSLSQTQGEELPELETREWSAERALASLAIKQVAFELYDGNVGGYASGREIAINPLAPFPRKTLLHEISHVMHEHTTDERMAEYQSHRGLMEFEAEATAHLALNSIGELTEEAATVSRGYIQGWLQGNRPPATSFSNVLNKSSRIVTAGYDLEVRGD